MKVGLVNVMIIMVIIIITVNKYRNWSQHNCTVLLTN